MKRSLKIAIEYFQLKSPFVISRGPKTEAAVVTVTLSEMGVSGRGECVPYPRYKESPASVIGAVESVRQALESGMTRAQLQNAMPAGAARNAIDCAMWDLEAKRLGIRAHEISGSHRLMPAVSAYTISVGTPQQVARAAEAAKDRPVLKLKLAGEGDAERIAAVREAAPACELIVDANEAWSEAHLLEMFTICENAGVAVIEQPLPAGQDEALAHMPHPIPICADESVHHRAGLASLRNRYDAINIKLDKTGGLTEALALAREAQKLDFAIMVGSMVGSSLSMAPAMLLSPYARWIDLDGPLLLAEDRNPGLRFDGSTIFPPEPQMWG